MSEIKGMRRELSDRKYGEQEEENMEKS